MNENEIINLVSNSKYDLFQNRLYTKNDLSKFKIDIMLLINKLINDINEVFPSLFGMHDRIYLIK